MPEPSAQIASDPTISQISIHVDSTNLTDLQKIHHNDHHQDDYMRKNSADYKDDENLDEPNDDEDFDDEIEIAE